MDAGNRVELRIELPIRQEDGRLECPGTEGRVVEHLGDDAFLVEFRLEHELKRKV